MIHFLQKVSNWRFILPLFLLFAFFTFYLFPNYQKRLNEITGTEVVPLDLRFAYSADDVTQLFNQLGAEGRQLYSNIVGRIDMVYPVVYGLFLMLLMANLLKKLVLSPSKKLLLALLPLLGVLFDYGENLNTLSLLQQNFAFTTWQVTLGAWLTRLKHIVLYTSLFIIVILATTLLVRKMKRRN